MKKLGITIGILSLLMFVGGVAIPSYFNHEYANSLSALCIFSISAFGMIWGFTAGMPNDTRKP